MKYGSTKGIDEKHHNFHFIMSGTAPFHKYFQTTSLLQNFISNVRDDFADCQQNNRFFPIFSNKFSAAHGGLEDR